jgi:hypothetical protein
MCVFVKEGVVTGASILDPHGDFRISSRGHRDFWVETVGFTA